MTISEGPAEDTEPDAWTRAMTRRRSDEDIAYSDSRYKGSVWAASRRQVEWPDMPRTGDAG